MQPYRDGSLVTDAHHNRVLRVGLNGDISVFEDFAANVVPTGSTLSVVQFSSVKLDLCHTSQPRAGTRPPPSGGRIATVAAGAPLLVDVEARGHTVYGLAQGHWPYLERRARKDSQPPRTPGC